MHAPLLRRLRLELCANVRAPFALLAACQLHELEELFWSCPGYWTSQASPAALTQ